jgi:hypothetical protein
MKVSTARNFLLAETGKWLFAKTYSKTVQALRQDLASVSPKRHKPLF